MVSARVVIITLVTAGIVGGLVWALRPGPLEVDMTQVTAGPMQVTVAAEGVTRVREPYLVTAPISGMATRSPLHVGDAVVRGETVVALIQPAEPAFLDARSRAQAEAAVDESQAALQLAQVNLARAQADLDYAESQLARNRELAARGTIPQRMLEDTQQMVETQRATLEAAVSEVAMRQATLIRTQAQLLGPEGSIREPGDCCIDLTAPQSGTVLSVENESARLVQAGEALLSIGDLNDLEIEVDLLSQDAVRLAPGASAFIERWGGPGVLEARVRRIDPRGFTRVSALGIEEQRVRVILDFADPAEARPGLGDAFRVFVRIVTWEEEDVLQVPISALFRSGADWAVFRLQDGTARLTRIEVGQRTQDQAQVLSGLSAGDVVVAFPGDRVSDGAAIAPR